MSTFLEQIQTELPYRRELRRLAFNILKDEADVEDVLQWVHLRAWTAAATSEETIDNAKAFLRRITRTAALDALRKKRRDEGVRARYTRDGSGAVVLNRDHVEVVAPSLTERQAELVRLVAETGSYEQAALNMDITPDAAREMGERVIEQLRGEACAV